MSESGIGLTLLDKARQACRSARLLLEIDDVGGACNRAYYAMFDAARAALLLSDENETLAAIGKSHQGLVTRFSNRLIRTGVFEKDLGRSLRRVQETRLAADYRADAVIRSDAEDAVAQAERFLDAVLETFGPERASDDDRPSS